MRKREPEVFYAFARRPVDGAWVMLCEFKTRGQAEAIMHRILITYGQRYHRDDLQIMSESEVQQRYGKDWKKNWPRALL
jgi:hypothetical protein